MSIKILRGDCRDVLRAMPDESVHMVCTSPPYWGLRDYGTATWEGGEPGCGHIEVQPQGRPGRETPGGRGGSFPVSERAFKTECRRCGARRIDSQLGLEPTYQEYVANMVEVFREVRRVLRKDGTLWLNLGDSYAQSEVRHRNKESASSGLQTSAGAWSAAVAQTGRKLNHGALKPKDLCGIPWRVAFALQADGWYLRQDIIWSKPNPMPESVRDRCTKSHEYIFLLSKSGTYYYDAEAIAEQGKDWSNGGPGVGITPTKHYHPKNGGNEGLSALAQKYKDGSQPATRNKRSVWEVTTAPFSEAHFATFPPALIEPCIMAGTSEKGCCAKCGAPWVRDIEKTRTFESGSGRSGNMPVGKNGAGLQGGGETLDIRRGPVVHVETLGWSPSCRCARADADGTDFPLGKCVVLDPFGGAGTTGLVADRLGRNAILIELNSEYAQMAERRLKDDAGMFAEVS